MTEKMMDKLTLEHLLPLTASAGEFSALSKPDQTRVRALVFIANKQLGVAYAVGRYVDGKDIPGPARKEFTKQVADQAREYLENAGDLFLGRPSGFSDLSRLVSHASEWSMSLVTSALTSQLSDDYVINLANGTVARIQ